MADYARRHGHSTSDHAWLLQPRGGGRTPKGERGAVSDIAAALPNRTRKAVFAALQRMYSAGNKKVGGAPRETACLVPAVGARACSPGAVRCSHLGRFVLALAPQPSIGATPAHRQQQRACLPSRGLTPLSTRSRPAPPPRARGRPKRMRACGSWCGPRGRSGRRSAPPSAAPGSSAATAGARSPWATRATQVRAGPGVRAPPRGRPISQPPARAAWGPLAGCAAAARAAAAASAAAPAAPDPAPPRVATRPPLPHPGTPPPPCGREVERGGAAAPGGLGHGLPGPLGQRRRARRRRGAAHDKDGRPRRRAAGARAHPPQALPGRRRAGGAVYGPACRLGSEGRKS